MDTGNKIKRFVKKLLVGISIGLFVAYLGFIGYSVFEYWMEKDKPHLRGRITPIQVTKIDKDIDTVEINPEYNNLICTEPSY